MMETVCAFANEPGLGGGYLLLGVSRDPQDLFCNAYRIDGIDDTDKLQSDLASQCASIFNRPVRPRVSVEELSGKSVVVVFVPEAAPTEKPIFLQKNRFSLHFCFAFSSNANFAGKNHSGVRESYLGE